MPTPTSLTVPERLVQVLQHLGLPRVHVAGRVAADWSAWSTSHPETIASLTLICPSGMDQHALQPLTSRLLIVSGDQGAPAAVVQKSMETLSSATLITLSEYFGHARADVTTERKEAIAAAMLTFLTRMDEAQSLTPVALPTSHGEVAGISYHVQGAGPPLLLLPLGLAAAQWAPLLPRLQERYCTIVLGGAMLGSVASLETRGQSTGYLGVVRSMVDELSLQPGETILDVGCGSGVLDRWLARRTAGANPIVAADIHGVLLQEASALAKKDGLESVITFRAGNAEALPFPDSSFDVAISATVMELLDAQKMLREMIRVTRPGGRVGIVVRAVDMTSFVNLPLRPALKARVEALPNGTSGPQGCADASLYRRFHESGLTAVRMLPQLATYAGAQAHSLHERAMAVLTPEELAEWHAAVAQAQPPGTFFVALPFHCAVGTKPA